MILHYNIYPSNVQSAGHIVRFYLSDCDPVYIVILCNYIHDRLDSSIGTCDYMDWDYKSGIGISRICIQRGVDLETTKVAMDQLQEELKGIEELNMF